MTSIGVPEILVIVIVAGCMVLPLWRICTKMGYPGFLSLAALMPVVNLGLYLFLAFSDWPVLKELAALRQTQIPNAMPSSSTHICTRCGTAIPDDSAFCSRCGLAQR